MYYHCTGQRGKCIEKGYAKEREVETQFIEVVERITLPPTLVAWTAAALAESQHDTRKLQAEAVQMFKMKHSRVQKRLDTMYLDKLDARIAAEEYDRLASTWKTEQQQLEQQIKNMEAETSQMHLPEGIELPKLAKNAGNLFEMQPAREKRRLLNCVVSNSNWMDGKLKVEYSQPFDLFST